MIPMRHLLELLIALGLVGFVACEGGEDFSLTPEIPCDTENPCPTGYSCRANKCIELGSLGEDETCTETIQCREGLVCREFACQGGCTDLYYLDDCEDGTWCKPVPGETITTDEGVVPAGECAPSECNPAAGDRCADDSACVALSEEVGFCLPYCAYGFDVDGYFDSCEDDGDFDYACQPMGLNSIPVCFPAGGSGAPGVGLPGCDAVWNPCRPGAICYNVVCRELCSEAQLNPCTTGQTCSVVGQRADLAFCRAD